VVDPSLGRGVVGQQVHRADGVLEGQRHVTEFLEHRGEHEVGACQELLRVVGGGPALDGLDLAGGQRDVAAAPEQVGLDEAGALLELGEAELTGGADDVLGVVVEVAVVEPREVLQFGDGARQLGGARVRAGCGRSGAASRPHLGGAGHKIPSAA
jgi:hypothetical protein